MDNVECKMRDVKCRWYFGPTRTGKTWKALKDMGVDLTTDIPA